LLLSSNNQKYFDYKFFNFFYENDKGVEPANKELCLKLIKNQKSDFINKISNEKAKNIDGIYSNIKNFKVEIKHKNETN